MAAALGEFITEEQAHVAVAWLKANSSLVIYDPWGQLEEGYINARNLIVEYESIQDEYEFVLAQGFPDEARIIDGLYRSPIATVLPTSNQAHTQKRALLIALIKATPAHLHPATIDPVTLDHRRHLLRHVRNEMTDEWREIVAAQRKMLQQMRAGEKSEHGYARPSARAENKIIDYIRSMPIEWPEWKSVQVGNERPVFNQIRRLYATIDAFALLEASARDMRTTILFSDADADD